MTPIRPRGSGPTPSISSEAGNPTSGDLSASSPADPRAPLPSEIFLDSDLTRLPVNLRGQTILVVFNPAARDGRIGQELPHLQKVLERAGARVIPVETLPEPEARRTRIQEVARRVLAEGNRVYILPYGGDGTIWETVGEVVRAAGIPLEPGPLNPEAIQRFNSQAAFFLAKKGTASDNAVQVDAPSRIGAMPRYLRGAVELPYWFPTIETVESPGVFEVAGHNYGLGASGYLFSLRAENLRTNPTALRNRGLLSYLRLLPHATANRYGLLGFDVELKHFGSEGTLIREATMRASEVITTPNRIMAGVGGVPGGWGETKVVVLPPGPAGIFAISEYIFRGLATKMGWNLVGPRSRLRTLSLDRQWLIQPGERVDVRLRVPSDGMTGLLWDLLRSAHERNVSWRWLRPGPEVPAAGEPLLVPGQRNGDVVSASTGFSARSPGIPIAMLAHPNSLAVRLARSSAFINGDKPLISDQQTTSFLPDHEPTMWSERPDSLRVRAPFVSRPRLEALLARYGVPRQYGIDLLISSQGAWKNDQGIDLLAQRRVTVERAHEFLESNLGDHWLETRRAPFRAFGERALEGGVPLLTGIAAMVGGEALADRLGLDRVRDRELRFGLVVYLSHAVQANLRPVWEVAANRMLGRSYDFIQTRSARAAGEVFTQWTLERQPFMTRAMASAWASNHLGLEMGIVRGLSSRMAGWGLIPFRAAWNMGEGLIFSRITESLVRDLPDDSPVKRYAPTAAFFVPDLLRISGQGRVLSFLESRPMRFASRLFAAGFISDMAFTGIHRAVNGDRAGYELSLDYRTAELRRQRGDIPWYSWRQIPRLVAPSLSAYMDSHRYLFGEELESRTEIRREDTRQSSILREAVQQELAWIPSVLGQEVGELFREEIRLSPVERDMQEQLTACRGGRLLRETAGFEESARYLCNQFRGVLRTPEQARRHLARIYAFELQQSIAYLQQMPLGENGEIRALFDERGRVRPNRQASLERWVQTGETGPLFASL